MGIRMAFRNNGVKSVEIGGVIDVSKNKMSEGGRKIIKWVGETNEGVAFCFVLKHVYSRGRRGGNEEKVAKNEVGEFWGKVWEWLVECCAKDQVSKSGGKRTDDWGIKP